MKLKPILINITSTLNNIFRGTKVTLCIVLFSYSVMLPAQLTDLARLDYTALPRGSSKVKYSRLRAIINYPISLNKEGSYLLLGFDYSNINFFSELPRFFNRTEIDEFQLLDINIGYTAQMQNGWRIGARLTPGVSSNLTAKALSIDDIVISGDLIFIKDNIVNTARKRPSKLILGISYSENRGFPFPIPFINYYREFHQRWSYTIGIPKTNLQFHLSDKHKFKMYAELDGFTTNIQRGLIADSDEVAQILNLSLVVSGLQYEYYFTKHIQFFARTAYILNQKATLKNADNDILRVLDSSNKLYLRTGIRFKI